MENCYVSTQYTILFWHPKGVILYIIIKKFKNNNTDSFWKTIIYCLSLTSNHFF